MEFTHFNEQKRAKMVDISDKQDTARLAVAQGIIKTSGKKIIDLIKDNKLKKGDVLAVAQVAGIMGAKNTSSIVPMTHNINLSGVNIDFSFDHEKILISAEVKTTGKTGVEMEALTAVSICALTIYDMCKSVDRGMIIEEIKLVRKQGGKSGVYEFSKENI